jgi:hypothetical protein
LASHGLYCLAPVLDPTFGSVRREALDNFLLIGRAQIETILEEYVAFYNSQRPHQGSSKEFRGLGSERR